jgi:hypothetical protein
LSNLIFSDINAILFNTKKGYYSKD